MKTTTRYRTAHELAESILDTVRAPLVVLDAELRVVLANASFLDMFQVEDDEAIGTCLYELGDHRWDIAALRELLTQVAQGKTEVTDFEVEHDSGSIGAKVMLLNARRMVNPGNDADTILLAIEEVTQRKRHERALRQARDFSESVIATVREPLVVLDAELRVISANPSFFDTFEVDADATLGRAVFELGNRQWDIPELRELLREIVLQNRTIRDFEVEHDFESIGRRVMLLNARRMVRSGNHTGTILLAIEDVTDRATAQRELEHKQRALEAANAHLEGFSYSVSHDLRAPLRAIDGFARALAEDYGDVVDDEGRRLLGIITKNARKMGQLIDDLLAFSRLSRRPVEPEHVDMTILARAAFEDARAAAPGRSIRCELGMLPAVRGDRAMLRQVWANLLDNAVKYSRPRDEAVVEIAGGENNGEARFTVRDNGVGFDAAYADKLFGVFQRLHKEREFEGTGVGLALVHRIIESHGGRIWATSTVGEGATFEFALPTKVEDRHG